jgi:nitrate reductase gamma subunit
MTESALLHFTKHTLHELALITMVVVYTIRLVWFFRWKPGKERQPTTNKQAAPDVSRRKGILYSWGIIGMPWVMESSRTKLLLYAQFVLFHLGVVAAITLAFGLSMFPRLFEPAGVVTAFRVFIGAAFLIGVMRIIRRLTSPMMRAISSPDDHFSLWLLTVWFFFAFLAAPNNTAGGEWHMITFFILSSFFLVYVPFSKISHYLYYPFTRMWFGKSMGYRGVYPLKRGPKPDYLKA